GRGHDDFAHAVRREQLELRSGFDDEHIAVLAGEVQLAVRGERRGAERSAAGDALLIDALSSLDVMRLEDPVDLEDVEQVAIDHRRRDVRTAARRAPGDEGTGLV